MRPFFYVVIVLGIVFIGYYAMAKVVEREDKKISSMTRKAAMVNRDMYENKCKKCSFLQKCNCQFCPYTEYCERCPYSDCMEAYEEDRFEAMKRNRKG